MRILASADLHGFLDVYGWVVQNCREHEAELLLLAGDLLTFEEEYDSVEEGMRASAEKITAVLATLEIPILFIMGNDDAIEFDTDIPGLIPVHQKSFEMGGYRFVGYAGGPPFMGGPNERDPERLEAEIEALKPMLDERTVLMTHYPAAGILDGTSYGRGLEPLRQLTDENRVMAHIHGHIHRAFGREGTHFNVASAGEKRCMMIELPSLKHQILRE